MGWKAVAQSDDAGIFFVLVVDDVFHADVVVMQISWASYINFGIPFKWRFACFHTCGKDYHIGVTG
jgi:hypothetical protein